MDFMTMKNGAVGAAIIAMQDAGLKISFEEAKAKIDLIYRDRGIEFQTVFDEMLLDIIEREANLKTYPGVFSTLIELLKMGIKLAIVSDAPSKEAWLRLSHLNLHHIFDVIVTYDETRERKPSPVPFNMALEQLKMKASECLMIGDWAERDMVGAKVVGMKTVFARYGDTFNTVHPGSDYDISDIRELIQIVKKENGLNSKND
ncbi:unnamed protein product [Rotaria sp. Silwood1]|nr:unnamed protein product [Rotaria sp. Silwood1]